MASSTPPPDPNAQPLPPQAAPTAAPTYGHPVGTPPGTGAPLGTSAAAGSNVLADAERQALAGVAKWWWLFIVTGIIWILLALVILQFSSLSLVTVGYVVGFMLIATGIEEIFVASATERLKWLWYILGIVLLLGGLWAVFNPGRTAFWLAADIGLLFSLIGIMWIVEAVMSRHVNSLWVLGLVSGILMVLLAIWAATETLGGRTVTLLLVAGIWAIMHGIGDIIRAFQLKKLGTLVGPTA